MKPHPTLLEMAKYRHFVLMKRFTVVSRRNRPCNPCDPTYQLSVSTARRIARRKGLEIGFVLTDHDPVFAVFINDSLRNARLVKRVVADFPGAHISRAPTSFAALGQISIIGHCPAQHARAEQIDHPSVEVHTERFVIGFPGFPRRGVVRRCH